MKKVLLVIMTVVFFTGLLQAQNPVPKELVEKPWGGFSEQSANFTKSGKIQLVQTLRLTLNSDNSVSGTSSSKMILDGVSYSNINYINGTFYPSNWTVYIQDGTSTYTDVLPYSLRWCKGTGTLQFYTNATHPGYYILKGNISDDCGGKSLIEFTDYTNAYKQNN